MAELDYFPQDRIVKQITEEFTSFLTHYDAAMAQEKLPPINKTKDSSNGDFTVLLKGACAKRKIDVEKYTTDLSVALNAHLEGKSGCYLKGAEALRGYINLYVNRSNIFRSSVEVSTAFQLLLFLL